jgi:hypothetical protein
MQSENSRHVSGCEPSVSRRSPWWLRQSAPLKHRSIYKQTTRCYMHLHTRRLENLKSPQQCYAADLRSRLSFWADISSLGVTFPSEYIRAQTRMTAHVIFSKKFSQKNLFVQLRQKHFVLWTWFCTSAHRLRAVLTTTLTSLSKLFLTVSWQSLQRLINYLHFIKPGGSVTNCTNQGGPSVSVASHETEMPAVRWKGHATQPQFHVSPSTCQPFETSLLISEGLTQRALGLWTHISPSASYPVHIQDDRKFKPPISDYLLMPAIQYNSWVWLYTARTSPVMLQPAGASPSVVFQLSKCKCNKCSPSFTTWNLLLT